MDEQLKNEQRETAFELIDDTNRRVRDTLTTPTFWVGIFLSIVATGALHWNVGYPLGMMSECVCRSRLFKK